MTDQIVLWNAKETVSHCEEFVRDYAKMRNALLDHYQHKGHVALRYSDDWSGFHSYCLERLKLESKLDTIKLQISTAQVSREVGVDVPMVIGRQFVKLPPDKRKEVYDEVIGAREKAGQRSANQMEQDVRRVVRRIMGVEEPAPAPPVSTTDEVEPGVITLEDDSTISDIVPAYPVPEGHPDNPFTEPLNYREAYSAARALLCRFASAVGNGGRDEDIMPVYIGAREFLNKYREQ